MCFQQPFLDPVAAQLILRSGPPARLRTLYLHPFGSREVNRPIGVPFRPSGSVCQRGFITDRRLFAVLRCQVLGFGRLGGLLDVQKVGLAAQLCAPCDGRGLGAFLRSPSAGRHSRGGLDGFSSIGHHRCLGREKLRRS